MELLRKVVLGSAATLGLCAATFMRQSSSLAHAAPSVLCLAELYWRTVASTVARRRLTALATSSGPARPAALHTPVETAISTALEAPVALLSFEWVLVVPEGAATLGLCAVTFMRQNSSLAHATPSVLRLGELYWRTVAHAMTRKRLAALAASSGPAGFPEGRAIKLDVSFRKARDGDLGSTRSGLGLPSLVQSRICRHTRTEKG